MSKKRYKRKSSSARVGEPQGHYDTPSVNKSLHVFKSMEEMEEDNYKWLASLTPQQHLANATELIKRIFADELKKNPGRSTNISYD